MTPKQIASKILERVSHIKIRHLGIINGTGELESLDAENLMDQMGISGGDPNEVRDEINDVVFN